MGGAQGVRAAAFGALTLAAVLLVSILARSPAPELSLPFSDPGGEASAERAYGELPLAFERDAGRSGPAVDFLARTPAGTTFVGPDGATLALGDGQRTEALRLQLANGAAAVEPNALERVPGEVNHLVGDRDEWRTGIAAFERVRYPDVYPGISLDWYGNQRQLEYDFRLAPGADPQRIALQLGGAERLRLASSGDLVIDTGDATVRQKAPVAYQSIAGERQPIEASFALAGRTVGFELGAYDRSRALVIDPLVISYLTYLGGTGQDVATSIAVDSAGAAYITGETSSTDFNTVGEIEDDEAVLDVFVSKLTPVGNALAYSTYLGGSGGDSGNGIAVDATGAAYVTGVTGSTDYCTGAGCSFEDDEPGGDAFVSKLNPAGNALAYSTYLGGDQGDTGYGVAVDSAGAAYITGQTDSTDYCTTECSIEDDEALTDVFVSKLNPAGSALAYSTYLGGDGSDGGFGNLIAVDSAGAAYVTGPTNSTNFNTLNPIEGNGTGTDVFVSKLNPAGNALAYSTYLSGDGSDQSIAVAVDSAGAAYVTGQTDSTDWCTGLGCSLENDEPGTDAFVSKLNPAGSALAYSTYLGGDLNDTGYGVAVDSAGAAHVAGQTTSTDFDTVGQIEGDSAVADAFISKLNPAGSALAYSTYLGGNNIDGAFAIDIDGNGAAYVTGATSSTDLNTIGRIEGDSGDNAPDAFIAKLSFDADTDGVPDDADDCPTSAGSESNDGCPVADQPAAGDGDCERAQKRLKKAKKRLKNAKEDGDPQAIAKAKKKKKKAKKRVREACS